MSCGLPKKDVYIVDQSNEAALSLMEKLANNCHPGSIIPVSAEEFKALNDSVIRIELPEQQAA